MHLVVVTGTRDEMRGVREDLAYYRARRLDWTPYRADAEPPLAAHARAVAAERLFDCEVADVDGLLDRIAAAGAANEVVVLIVDPFANRIEAYRRVLAEADQRSGAATAVLAPSSGADAESVRHRDELRIELAKTFATIAARRDGRYRPEIASRDEFDADLGQVLEEAKNRLFRTGRVRWLPAGKRDGARPILQGP